MIKSFFRFAKGLEKTTGFQEAQKRCEILVKGFVELTPSQQKTILRLIYSFPVFKEKSKIQKIAELNIRSSKDNFEFNSRGEGA